MENVDKIIKSKINSLNNTKSTFEDLFTIIHDQGDKVFAEYLDGYKLKEVSYNECKDNSLKMGTYLKGYLKEYDKGQFIGLYMDNSLLWIYTFWGLLMAGYKPLLINKRLSEELNDNIVDLLNIKVILTDCLCDLKTKTHFLDLNVINDIEIDNNFIWENEIGISTSATSLNVKVCVYDGFSIVEQIKNTKKIVKANPFIKEHYKGKLKILTFLPFYHIFGLVATYMWFSFFGRTFVFLKDFSTETILKTIRKHKVTHVFAVPMLWHGIYREISRQVSLDDKLKKKFAKGVKLSLAIQNAFPKLGKKLASKIFKQVQDKVFGNSIKFMISGGGYIMPEALRIINAIGYPLYNGFGMSEIGITSVELRLRPKDRLLGSIGRPFDSCEYMLNEDNILLVRGNSLCKRIITNNCSVDINNQEWFNTSDIASCDKKGYYYVSGRSDDVVIGSNGEKINPDLLEKNIFIPSAKRFSIIGYEGKLTLILELSCGLNPLVMNRIDEEVKASLTQLQQQGYSIESIYFTFEPIAAQTAIKVSRSILLKYIANGTVTLRKYHEFSNLLTNNSDELIDKLELKIKELMGQILNIDSSSIDSNSHFVLDLGGTSLDYLTLLVKLQEEFSIEFTATNSSNYYDARNIAYYIANKK